MDFHWKLVQELSCFTMICLTSPRIPMMIPEFPISAGCSEAPSLKGGKPVKIHCREGDVLCILAAAQKGQLSNQLPKCNVSPPRMVSQNPGTLVNPKIARKCMCIPSNMVYNRS